jgi:hypothetical protein
LKQYLKIEFSPQRKHNISPLLILISYCCLWKLQLFVLAQSKEVLDVRASGGFEKITETPCILTEVTDISEERAASIFSTEYK